MPFECVSRRHPGIRRKWISPISARFSPTSRAPSGSSGCSRWCCGVGPQAGRVGGGELTGAPGFRRMEAHDEAPIPWRQFKRQVAQEFLSGETLHGLAKRHDISRNLIRVWVEKYEAGVFADEARGRRSVAGLRSAHRGPRASCRQAGVGTGVSKGGFALRTAAEQCDHIRDRRPCGMSTGR